VTVQFTHEQELCDEPRLETAREPSQVGRKFRPAHPRSYPEGYGCYCADQNAAAFPGGPTPPKGPNLSRLGARNGDASRGERTGQAKPAKPPQRGGAKKRITLLQAKSDLRVKRSDP
jgi:hypothetical protein